MRIRLSTSKQAIDPYGPAMSSLGTLSDDDPFLDITDPVGQGVLDDELAGEEQWREDFQRRMREAKAPTARTNRLNQRADALNQQAAQIENMTQEQWRNRNQVTRPAEVGSPPPTQNMSNMARTGSRELGGGYVPRSELPQGGVAAPQPTPSTPSLARSTSQWRDKLQELRNEYGDKGVNFWSAAGGPGGGTPSISFGANFAPGEDSDIDPLQFETNVLQRDQFGSQEEYAQAARDQYNALREKLQSRFGDTATDQPGTAGAPAAAAEPDESGHPASGVYPGGGGAPTRRPEPRGQGEMVQPTTSPDPNRNESPWRSAYRTAKDVYGDATRGLGNAIAGGQRRYMQHEKQYGADETAHDIRYYNALQRKLQQEGRSPDEARRIAQDTVQSRAQERSKPPEFSMYKPWSWF